MKINLTPVSSTTEPAVHCSFRPTIMGFKRVQKIISYFDVLRGYRIALWDSFLGMNFNPFPCALVTTVNQNIPIVQFMRTPTQSHGHFQISLSLRAKVKMVGQPGYSKQFLSPFQAIVIGKNNRKKWRIMTSGKNSTRSIHSLHNFEFFCNQNIAKRMLSVYRTQIFIEFLQAYLVCGTQISIRINSNFKSKLSLRTLL